MFHLKNVIGAGLFLALAAAPAQAEWPINISEYADGYRWLQQADRLADAQVTYEACGWGLISLLPAALEASKAEYVKVALWDEFIRRFDDAVRERRRIEVFLMSFGQPAPSRIRGLFAAGGCGDAIRREIEQMGPR